MAERRPGLKSTRRRWLRRGLYVVYLGILAWIGVKLCWWARYGVPPTRTPDVTTVWRFYYDPLWSRGPFAENYAPTGESLDVLLLGGSVLEQVGPAVARRLEQDASRPVRLSNVAQSAHTSRDSLLKYELVKELPIDVVVVFDGINDVRMNCCPPDAFRDDYTHCAHYAAMRRHVEAGTMSLRSAVAHSVESKIPLGAPDEESLDEGALIRTGPAFRANVESILRDARARRRLVVLVSMPIYLAEGYTQESFEQGLLDYGPGSYRLRVEVWGRPAHVKTAIDVHNESLRDLAAAYPEALLVDLDRDFPRSGREFSDVCHLTEEGCVLWADLVVPRIIERLR